MSRETDIEIKLLKERLTTQHLRFMGSSDAKKQYFRALEVDPNYMPALQAVDQY